MAKPTVWCTLGAMALRCLLVDDNRDFIRAAGELLDHEGISVVGGASTGDEACRACEELKPDVVLIDIDLGDETGIEVARRLAGQQQGAEQTCMILVSAYSEDDFADMIADSPAVSFLPKAALSGTAIRGILDRTGGSVVSAPKRDSR
jgi:CheY-like chemotaxis protein